MYKIIALISEFIRLFILPNPFTPLDRSQPIVIGSVAFPITSVLANYIAAPVLHTLTYAVVGIYYSKDEHGPAKGSFLYLLFYCIHVGMLYLMSIFGFEISVVILIIATYIALHIAINSIKNKLIYGV